MALFAVSALALIDAALRVAERFTDRGLERVVAAAPLAAATAVTQSLVLGLFGLGTHPVALSAVAIATWSVIRLVVWREATRPLTQFTNWLSTLERRQLAGLGAIAAVALICIAAFVRSPYIGHDSLAYHLPEAIDWVHNGRPGWSQVPVHLGLPVESYPLTDEVLLAWQFGLAGSLVPLAAWPVALTALGGTAAFLGLRRRGATTLIAALGIGAFVTVPHLFSNLNGLSSDAGSISWMLVTAALCVCSRDRPALLCPAVIATSLSVGTRTTTAPILAALLVWSFWSARKELRSLVKQLVAAVLLAVGAGGVWYIRNLIVHGSPFWPLVPAPWGDPGPAILEQSRRFIEVPIETAQALRSYSRFLAGGLVLIVGGLLAPLISRTRDVFIAATVTLATFALWTNVPFTGLPKPPLGILVPLATSRYLLPTMAVGTVALVIAARSRRAGPVAVATLGIAIAWNVAVMPSFAGQVPSLLTLVAGAVIGAFAASAFPVGRLPSLVPRVPGLARAAAMVGAAALVLAFVAPGYVLRHAEVSPLAPELTRWFAEQPAFKEGDEKVAMTERVLGPLAGDELKHDVELISEEESCSDIQRRLNDEWVVVSARDTAGEIADGPAVSGCLGDAVPVYEDSEHKVYFNGPTAPVPTISPLPAPTLKPPVELPTPVASLVPSVSPVPGLVP